MAVLGGSSVAPATRVDSETDRSAKRRSLGKDEDPLLTAVAPIPQ